MYSFGLTPATELLQLVRAGDHAAHVDLRGRVGVLGRARDRIARAGDVGIGVARGGRGVGADLALVVVLEIKAVARRRAGEDFLTTPRHAARVGPRRAGRVQVHAYLLCDGPFGP